MRMSRPSLRVLLRLLLVALTILPLGLSNGAVAQGHPRMAARTRPLQDRLAQADLVLVAEVVGLSDGRIEVAAILPLAGAPPERFEIKRRRSSPPPLAIHDRALLLLRGARPPYVLVDEPAETIRLVDARGEEAWIGAVQEVLSHRDDPAALARRMLGWIDQGPASLRNAALISLESLLSTSATLREEVALDRAAAAARSDLPADARAISAQLASGSALGQDRLVTELAHAENLEATSLRLGLQLGSLRGHEDLATLYERALASDDPELRLVAARDPAPALRLGEPAEQALARIAEEDSDPLVQQAARKTLGRLHRGQ